MSAKRLFYITSGCAVLGMAVAGLIFTGGLKAYAKPGYGQLGVFTQVLTYINDYYVENVNSDSLIDGAITGLLARLDPHSTYLDPDRFKKIQERNKGTYYGIGISFSIVDGNLTVIAPIEGSPSYKLGIRAGDIITKIDGKSAKGIDEQEVFDKLRGDRGTKVHVSIYREGEPNLLEFDIIRDEIPIFSVPYSFMLTPGTGYVRLIRFSATTSDELEKALDKLHAQGMQRLVLDLRGNSGGYLNEATDVADKFLPAGKRIVYTRGRLPDSNEDYYSTGRGKEGSYPLIVLVDHGSASASEIVSGAMQDWDRGLVLGVTTFGKGLVQRQYALQNNGALLLTVARYYTPSGRLIQRDYHDREKYLTEDVSDIEKETDSDSARAKRPEFHTAAGRVVYGGGGITPDVKIDKLYPYPKLQRDLDAKHAYFDFANHFIATQNPKYPGFDAFNKSFTADDQVINDFTSFLKEKKISYDADSLKAQSDMVKRAIKSELALNLWGENERYQVIIAADPALQEALTYFPQAELMARGEVSQMNLPSATGERSERKK